MLSGNILFYNGFVVSASLLIEARRRAGLSQRGLAVRAGLPQQEIARYERGRVTPSLERLRALITACGFELTFGLARADDSYDEQIAAAFMLSPKRRLQRALADAQPLRAARAKAAGTQTPSRSDVFGVLAALQAAEVEYTLIGELAEALHGSPLLPLTRVVSIVPRAGQREKLSTAISACGGQPVATAATTSPIDAPATFTLKRNAAELVVTPAPAGTYGYEDLRRDAALIRLNQNIVATVASLLDLVRIAEASEDRARVPALRRTLELTTTLSATRAA